MAFSTAITLATSAAHSASGAGSSVDCDAKRVARVTLAVSAVSGTTPSLSCALETSDDQLSWDSVGDFDAVSSVGSHDIYVGDLRKYLRARWTVAGAGASFTFSVTGKVILVYADPVDLGAIAVAASALSDVPMSDKVRALIVATDEIDGRFNGRYALPLVAWGEDLRRWVAILAATICILTRGTGVEGSDYEILKALSEAASQWARDVGAKKISPVGIVDSTPLIEESAPFMYTDAIRGW